MPIFTRIPDLMRRPSSAPALADLLEILGVAALYALLAELVLVYLSASSFFSAVWPPSGLALAVLLTGGKRYAWSVFLGAFVAYTMTGQPLWAATAIATGNTLAALLGAWLLTRVGRFDPALRSLRDYLYLIILAGFFATSVSALTGTSVLVASGFLGADTFFPNLLLWWMSDALGIMLMSPLILIWRQAPRDWFKPKLAAEAALLLGLTFLVGQVVFLDWLHDTIGLVAQSYWMFLFVTWAAMRLGIQGVVTVLIMTTVQALLSAVNGVGFFHDDIAKTHLTNYLFFMAILSGVGMTLATYFTELKAAQAKIEHLAFYDALTQLPNRRLLLDRLQRALAASARNQNHGALLFIDLDNFKTLNDTLGHDVGDLLLQEVARRLTACVRANDTVARLGGDEFVVMLEDLNESPEDAATQAETVGRKVLSTLNQHYQLASHLHRSTPSIGVTLFTGHKDRIDELLKRADLAMYQAKATGRNNLRFFDPEMQTIVTARATLEADLRGALRQKDQFTLHYQAQVDDRGCLTGAEALLRWQHPQRGLVAPDEFIALAEEIGLILPLGSWVLEASCSQLVAWAARPETAHLSLAVNVSARQFHQPDFVTQVLALLDHTGANPQRLKLELTESLLLNDVEDIIAKMTALKTRGVNFSLDDFGTGYSSLSYLKRLPLDQLKIDQSFVRDVFTDSNDAAIVQAIVALARSLGLAVIAEGVETEAQRDFLASQGCHAFQGYLFGPPVPIDQFELADSRGLGKRMASGPASA